MSKFVDITTLKQIYHRTSTTKGLWKNLTSSSNYLLPLIVFSHPNGKMIEWRLHNLVQYALHLLIVLYLQPSNRLLTSSRQLEYPLHEPNLHVREYPLE